MEFGKQVKTNYTVDKEKLLDTFDRAILTNSRIWLVSIQGKHFIRLPRTLKSTIKCKNRIFDIESETFAAMMASF